MATIKYLQQSKTTNAPIYLRFSLGRNKSFKRKTGLFIDSKQWSTTGFPIPKDKNTRYVKDKLKALEAYILEQFNLDSTDGKLINTDWLENKIDSFFGRVEITELDYLSNYCDYFLENLPYKVTANGQRGVSISTQRKYKTITNKIKAFETLKKKTYLIKDVDLNFRDEFIKYLEKVDKLSDNTIGRYIKVVKTICLDAKSKGYLVSEQLNSFKGYTVKTPKIILSIDELEQIKSKTLLKEALITTRDWLIIGFYTGQRVSDLLRMNKGFIKDVQGFKLIELTQVKTKKKVQIPLHPEVKAVLEKRGGDFPPRFANTTDSNATMFNRYLKELCRYCEINTMTKGYAYIEEDDTSKIKGKKRKKLGTYEKWRLISSHVCRRSFASHFYGNPKYPTPLLMNITAHSTEKMFLEYIGKTPSDYSLELAKIWATEALKSKKEPQLTVVKKDIVNENT